ncbi:Crp/Fnr family transcriptional regulator [Lunatibacter salilacus]|uniref:Crp/Fnr family transcriptional regulator n=1 Tax=Lunatibacter salilacus TaxID=2483804 RepID=UPI00131B42AE|nr:Crp/Fnr family transcriptional regulator [Lunatibacter salilacus]
MENRLKSELVSFLSKIPELSKNDVDLLAENIPVKFFKKGTILVKEGDVCNKCFFVLKGCLRQYLIINGVDKTTQFYTENQAAVFFTSFTNKIKSESHLSCVEDCILIVGEPGSEEEMNEQIPILGQITRKMMEQDFGKTQDELSYFIASSPEERYLNLIKTKPDLLQRVPQHQLASYIGISPESLSRIRKRLMKAG